MGLLGCVLCWGLHQRRAAAHGALSMIFVFLNRTSAREELRLQLGTLRFDLNVLADGLEKPKKKAAEAAKKAFLSKVGGLPTL